MVKKNKEINKVVDENSFLYKYNNDNKYKAKAQLIAWVVAIAIIVIYLNISSMNNDIGAGAYNSVLDDYNDIIEQGKKDEGNLLEEIDDNYNYDISVDVVKDTGDIINYKYSGKSYLDTMEINKSIAEVSSSFYKVDDYYYKGELDNLVLAKEEEIYDFGMGSYIELDKIKDYIDSASLDHVTNYSNGKKEYVYNLYVRDMVINNNTEDVVVINVVEEGDILNISIDYSNLIKIFDDTISGCKISYIYSNIDKIEEFHVIDDNINNLGDVSE